MIYLALFIFGLIIGSFLNAVIFRLWEEESFVSGRSHCMYCKHELAAKDLVPLFSFLFLGGRCRYCKKSISWQYPFVELITAVTFVLLALTTNYSLQTTNFIFALIFICVLIVIAVYDFKHYLILDKVIFPALVLAIGFALLNRTFIDGLYGGLLISGFFGFQYYVSGGKWIGFGDVKFGLFLGMLFGLKFSVVMLVMAYFIGAFVGIGLVLANRKAMGSKLPFGVFLSISAIIMLIYGQEITNWYFGLLGLT